MRATITTASVLAELTSSEGSILRLDDRTIEIILAPELTAGLSPGGIVLDLVRTDLTPDRHLGFLLEIPVALPGAPSDGGAPAKADAPRGFAELAPAW